MKSLLIFSAALAQAQWNLTHLISRRSWTLHALFAFLVTESTTIVPSPSPHRYWLEYL
jgi:hypothetical protein